MDFPCNQKWNAITELNSVKKLTQSEVETRLKEFNLAPISDYTGNRYNLSIKCGCGRTFTTLAIHVLNGRTRSCNHCFDPKPGQKYGLLAVKEINRGHCYCECECGNYCSVGVSQLKRRHIRSCGCLKSPKGPKNPRWSGYKGIGKWLWSSIKRQAQARHREFNVSIEDMWDLFIKQKGKCALSGVTLAMEPSCLTAHNKGTQTASLDRIDSKKGYTKENVQWVHKHVNSMKSDFEQSKFIEWCCTIAANNNNNNSNI